MFPYLFGLGLAALAAGCGGDDPQTDNGGTPPVFPYPEDNVCFDADRFASFSDFSTPRRIGVAVHLLKAGDPLEAGFGEVSIREDLGSLNRAFAPMNYAFHLQSYDEVFEKHPEDDTFLERLSAYNVRGAVNVYYMNAGKLFGAEGLTRIFGSPLDGTLILMHLEQNVADVLPHEMGHYFGLAHTFGYGAGEPAEGADGRECRTLGDRICDTRPDPGVPHCKNELARPPVCDDPAYAPDCNVMSYYHACGRNVFSPQQMAIMQCSVQIYYADLYEAPAPEEAFKKTVGCGEAGGYATLQEAADSLWEDPLSVHAIKGSFELCAGTYAEEIVLDLPGATFDLAFRARPGHDVVLNRLILQGHASWYLDTGQTQKVRVENVTFEDGDLSALDLKDLEVENVRMFDSKLTAAGGRVRISSGVIHREGLFPRAAISLRSAEAVLEGVSLEDAPSEAQPFLSLWDLDWGSGAGATSVSIQSCAIDSQSGSFVSLSPPQGPVQTIAAKDLPASVTCSTAAMTCQ